MITVFYDGKCGLCRREIEHYIRIAPAGKFAWVDITVTPEPFTKRGYGVKEGLKAFHVEDDTRKMHQGAAAFAVIWKHLPRLWPLLALLLTLPLALPLAEKLYAAFAVWRYRKLGYDRCDL